MSTVFGINSIQHYDFENQSLIGEVQEVIKKKSS